MRPAMRSPLRSEPASPACSRSASARRSRPDGSGTRFRGLARGRRLLLARSTPSPKQPVWSSVRHAPAVRPRSTYQLVAASRSSSASSSTSVPSKRCLSGSDLRPRPRSGSSRETLAGIAIHTSSGCGEPQPGLANSGCGRDVATARGHLHRARRAAPDRGRASVRRGSRRRRDDASVGHARCTTTSLTRPA